jgi:thiamine-phosphate pyrophosphorylase
LFEVSNLHGIYVVTDRELCPGRSHLDIAMAAVEAGACCVQLRDKSLGGRNLVELAKSIRCAVMGTKVKFIVNDRLDVALAVGADGVHLGQDDIPVSSARAVMGQTAIVGVSVGSVEEAVQGENDGASYVAVGPIFATATKSDAGNPVGLETITAVKNAVSVPVVAIGGIGVDNIASVAKAGADAAAVVSAVVCAPDMVEAVRALSREFEKGFSARCIGGN